jgi:dipeptidyl aminopeptidase/acylaminoacyl peptidase
VLKESSTVEVDPGYLSIAEPIEYPTAGGLTAHALYYRPKSADYVGPEGGKPPLLVLSHGGPTGATSSRLSLEHQYWTSRGFALLDVNYGGSSGYGRAYRERLNAAWGIVDVDDCVNGARYLSERGEVDPNRLAIRGGSAGGYTTLAALAFRDAFHAGASRFGLSELVIFAEETHKFESRYLHRLIAPYPARKDVYEARSPLLHADRISSPVLFLQGLEDKIVPPNQSEMMYESLKRRRIPTAYVTFEGEQHGFRKAASIKRALDAELYFFSRIFGFPLPEPVEPVEIANIG